MPISVMWKFKILRLESNYIKTLGLTNIYNYCWVINTSFSHYMSMEIIGKIYQNKFKNLEYVDYFNQIFRPSLFYIRNN